MPDPRESLLPDFILRQFSDGRVMGSFEGLVLFADLSGSTALAESLASHGRAGTEELSRILISLFGGMVDIVSAHGGFIGKFVGDAIACFFPERPPEYALACAVKLLIHAQNYTSFETAYGTTNLGVRIGIASGKTTWGVLGNDKLGYSYYFAGDPVHASALLQSKAARGEACLASDITAAGLITTPISPEASQLVVFQSNIPTVERTPLPDDVPLDKFVVASVASIPASEHRWVIPVFVRIQGLHWSQPDFHKSWLAVIRIVRQECEAYEAFLAELDFGDKGQVLPIFFGAPVAHEDDINRSLAMALKLRDRLRAIPGVDLSIGVAAGQAYAGLLGNAMRASYTCLGDVVNLAARLMESAAPGEIRCSASITTAKTGAYAFNAIGSLHLKGKAGEIPVFSVEAREAVAETRFRENMVGRRQELRKLLDATRMIFKGFNGGIHYIHGAPGSGKSRLVWAVHENLGWSDQTHGWHVLACDGILRAGYNPFTTWMRGLIGYREAASPADNRRALSSHIKRYLDQPNLDDELRRHLTLTESIVAGYLGFAAEDSVYAQLDPLSRQENWEIAVKSWIRAESRSAPTLFVLEDAQWLDEESAKLLTGLATNMEAFPFAMIICARLGDDGSRVIYHGQSDLPVSHLDLPPLRQEEVQILALRFLGSGTLAKELLEFLMERSGGNPFLLEQFILHARETGAVALEGEVWQIRGQADLPQDVETLVVARLDRLDPALKRMLQAASVIGRQFSVKILSTLIAPEDSGGGERKLTALCESGVREDLLMTSGTEEGDFVFKNAILHEAIYNMQMSAARKDQHAKVVQFFESQETEVALSRTSDMARHASLAGFDEKARYYYNVAGDWAAANNRPSEALKSYAEALARYEAPADRAQMFEKIGTIRELVGPFSDALVAHLSALEIQTGLANRVAMAKQYNSLCVVYDRISEYTKSLDNGAQALELARSEGDAFTAATALNNLALASFHKGDYPQAMEYAEQALDGFKLLHPAGRDRAANAQNIIGLIWDRQGQYAKALECHKAVLEIYREIGDRRAETFSLINIGAIYEHLGKYPEGVQQFEQALANCREIGGRLQEAHAHSGLAAIYKCMGRLEEAIKSFTASHAIYIELGDRGAVGATLTNLGVCHKQLGALPKALDYYQQALAIAEDLGDARGRGAALNNIGLLYKGMQEPNRALDYYEQSLAIWRDLGDRAGESLVQSNMGAIYDTLGDYSKALEVYEESLRCRREMGDRMGEGLCLNNVAIIYGSLGLFQKALKCYNESLAIRRDLGDRRGEANVLRNIGKAYLDQGDEEEAQEYFMTSLAIAEEVRNKLLIGVNLLDLSKILISGDRQSPQFSQGREYLLRAILIFRELNDRNRLSEAEMLAKGIGLFF